MEETTTLNGQSESVHYVWGAQLIKQTRGGQGTYYHADGLGSVKALTDASGNATDAYEYGAFGEALANTGATANAYRYTGEYYDEASQLQYNRARWYDATVGRFTSLDHLSGKPTKPASLHKYVYAWNDPIDVTDPSGLFGLMDSGIASNIASTLNTIQANFGFTFMNAAMNPDESDPTQAMIADVGFLLVGSLGPGSRMVGAIFSKGKQWIVKNVPSSWALGRNLALMGSLKCAGCQAHHLVPGKMASAKRARDILKACDIDINSPANGIWLPGRKSPSEWAGAVHNGPHFKDYGTVVSERILKAYQLGRKAEVERELQRIRNDLFEEGSDLFGLI